MKNWNMIAKNFQNGNPKRLGRLIWASPRVSALCASNEIGRRLIGRSCLYRPPVSLCPPALIAGYPCGRQSHIIPVGDDYLHLRVLFAFHVILLVNILLGEALFIIASAALDYALIGHQHLTAFGTEFHFTKHLKNS